MKNDINIKKNYFIHGESFPDGVMFNDDRFLSVSYKIRKGEIKNKIIKIDSILRKFPFLNNIIIIRGLVNFFEGSANQYIARNQIYRNKKDENFNKSIIFLNITGILFTGFFLYFLIPTLISFFLLKYDLDFNVLYAIEVFVRLILFILIFLIINLTNSGKKTSFFHGAEHKTILCYNFGEKINIKNVKKYPIYNPSCGTSFIFLLLIISIPVFYFLNYENIILKLVVMLLLLPLLIGLSFDISFWYGKHKIKKREIPSSKFFILQRLNTKEPEKEHLKISIDALTKLLDLYKEK